MLLLAAFADLWPKRQPVPEGSTLQGHPNLGHLGFIVISLVFVLLSVWQA